MEGTHRFLNVSDAASYLGVSAASLRKWSDRGLVRVYRTPGGQRRYAPEDLDGFLAAMRQPTVPQAIPRYGRGTDYGAVARDAPPPAAPRAEAQREHEAAERAAGERPRSARERHRRARRAA
jgi:excisionase family DNA binding protein